MALVNPAIAMSVKPLEIQTPQRNVLADYAQAMQIANAQREIAQRNALNQAYAGAYDPGTGKLNYNKLYQNVAAGGHGSAIPGIEKERLAGEKTQAEIDAKMLEVAGTRLKQARGLLTSVNSPEAYAQWRAYTVEQLPGLAAVIPDQYSPETVARLANEADKLLPQFKQFDVGGAQMTGTFDPATGKFVEGQQFADVPLPAAVEAQKARIAGAGRSTTNVILPTQEKEFEKELGKGQAKGIIDSRTGAEEAAQILQTNQVGRDILNSGAITGTGAEFLVGLNQALKQVGVDFGYANAADNSQAYAANMGANVGKLIKQFGAGTGLSDADRAYAERMAGGKINLTEAALRKIIDINDRAANHIIDLHNKKVKGIQTNIPLTVDKPTLAPTRRQSAADQIPGQGPTPSVAPMYARNPQTGERIMSVDGGNTWSPAR